jgi:hypothetical protein
VHEPLCGEAGKLTPQKTGNFRLVDFQYMGRTSLRESPRSDGLCYADRKVGLGETFLRVGQTDVGEDIAAAFLDLNLFAHACYSF